MEAGRCCGNGLEEIKEEKRMLIFPDTVSILVLRLFVMKIVTCSLVCFFWRGGGETSHFL